MVLKGYWPLSETTGSTANDYSRSNADEDIIGDPILGSSGIAGSSSYDFDGNDDYVRIPSMSFADKQSGSIWVNISETNFSYMVFAQKDGNHVYQLQVTPNFRIRVDTQGGKSIADSTTSASTDTWYHVVWTYESGELKIYVDGKHEATNTDGSGNILNDSIEGNIAARGNGELNMPGKICQARLYDHALTQQEVQYLYQVGKRGLHVSNKKTL